MPELPEVETVRRGVVRHVMGREVAAAQVLHPRTARHQGGGAAEFVDRLRGRTFTGSGRRGKFAWLAVDGAGQALLLHLGMSGQLRVHDGELEPGPHVRARLIFTDGGVLDFHDQRTFGYLSVEDLVPDPFGLAPSGLSPFGLVSEASASTAHIPASITHIAPDIFEGAAAVALAQERLLRTSRPVKTALLDQTIVSGIGNIYADEALWRAEVHPLTPANRLLPNTAATVLEAAGEVMAAAIAAGGTSFDSLYVNVNGESGYFARELKAYGQEGQPCDRCGTPMRRITVGGRSATFCPACQS